MIWEYGNIFLVLPYCCISLFGLIMLEVTPIVRSLCWRSTVIFNHLIIWSNIILLRMVYSQWCCSYSFFILGVWKLRHLSSRELSDMDQILTDFYVVISFLVWSTIENCLLCFPSSITHGRQEFIKQIYWSRITFWWLSEFSVFGLECLPFYASLIGEVYYLVFLHPCNQSNWYWAWVNNRWAAFI